MNEANDSEFVTRKWDIVNNNLKADYGVENEIIYNTDVLKSNLCDYNDAYILVRGDIFIIRDNEHGVALQNCASFTKC